MDISSVQSNIYTVPISSTALAAILNNASVAALEITGTVIISTADTLIINNPNLVVTGTGQIHQMDGVGRSFDTAYYPESPPEPVLGNELQVLAITSWDGVSFTGGWAHMYMPLTPADFSNCRLPNNLYYGGGIYSPDFSEYVTVENVTAIRCLGKLNNCYIGHNNLLELSLNGSHNIIEFNNCGCGFWGATTTPYVGNIIRHNTALDHKGEVFCYDCDRGRDNIANLIVASVNTSLHRIYPEGDGVLSGAFGYKKGPILILPSGAYFFVTLGAWDESNRVFLDVDVTGKYGVDALSALNPGDPMVLQGGFVENYIYGNVWTKRYTDTPDESIAGIALWGACCGNEIYNNVGVNSYDVSVGVANSQFDHSGETPGWTWPRLAINSSNHWYNNDFQGSYFWIASQYFDEQDKTVTCNDVGTPFVNYNHIVESNINISYGKIYDAINIKWMQSAPVLTDYPEPENAGKTKHVTFAAGSTITYYSPPSKRVKLRSPSGGKIRGKGAGKVSGKPQ